MNGGVTAANDAATTVVCSFRGQLVEIPIVAVADYMANRYQKWERAAREYLAKGEGKGNHKLRLIISDLGDKSRALMRQLQDDLDGETAGTENIPQRVRQMVPPVLPYEVILWGVKTIGSTILTAEICKSTPENALEAKARLAEARRILGRGAVNIAPGTPKMKAHWERASALLQADRKTNITSATDELSAMLSTALLTGD